MGVYKWSWMIHSYILPTQDYAKDQFRATVGGTEVQA